MDKPYYSLNRYLQSVYGEKLYKIALDAGLTCPNRDGTLSTGGCIFCSQEGSGDFAYKIRPSSDFSKILLKFREDMKGKQIGKHYIAYFQAYTGTYGEPSYLQAVFTLALQNEAITGISIATRPDCLPDEILSMLVSLKEQYPNKFIWIELGLQSSKESTATWIHRGYQLPCFEKAVHRLHALGFLVIVHIILGLPGEEATDILSTIHCINSLPVDGIKLQLLHILKGTELGRLYEEHPEACHTYETMEEYLNILITCINYLRPDIVIHRVTGDAPRKLLLAPLWSSDKRNILNTLLRQMKETGSYQGRDYERSSYAGSTDFV